MSIAYFQFEVVSRIRLDYHELHQAFDRCANIHVAFRGIIQKVAQVIILPTGTTHTLPVAQHSFETVIKSGLRYIAHLLGHWLVEELDDLLSLHRGVSHQLKVDQLYNIKGEIGSISTINNLILLLENVEILS